MSIIKHHKAITLAHLIIARQCLKLSLNVLHTLYTETVETWGGGGGEGEIELWELKRDKLLFAFTKMPKDTITCVMPMCLSAGPFVRMEKIGSAR
jgi:hypothetical protein